MTAADRTAAAIDEAAVAADVNKAAEERADIRAELDAMHQIHKALAPLEPRARTRVLSALCVLLEINASIGEVSV